jgi:hypothetical protein
MPSAPAVAGTEGETQLIPPVAAVPGDDGATQLIRPVRGGPGPELGATTQLRALPREDATELIPPVPPPSLAPLGDEGATQVIPQVASSPAAPGAVAGGGPGINETRHLPLISPEFDSLFHEDPEAAEAAPARRRAAPAARGRRRAAARRPASPMTIGIIVVLFCAVIGLTVGALSGGGGGGGGNGDGEREPEAVTAGTGSTDPGPDTDDTTGGTGDSGDNAGTEEDPGADVALMAAQATELSSLLEESGSGRQTVIKAVGAVQACERLNASAQELRTAAQERRGLVTRLDQLTLDALPEHQELATALRDGWPPPRPMTPSPPGRTRSGRSAGSCARAVPPGRPTVPGRARA